MNQETEEAGALIVSAKKKTRITLAFIYKARQICFRDSIRESNCQAFIKIFVIFEADTNTNLNFMPVRHYLTLISLMVLESVYWQSDLISRIFWQKI